jgi:hypothetical protein
MSEPRLLLAGYRLLPPDPADPSKVSVEPTMIPNPRFRIEYDQESEMPEKSNMWMASTGSQTGPIKSTVSEAALEFFKQYPHAGEYVTVSPGSEIGDGVFITNLSAMRFSGMTRERAQTMFDRMQRAVSADAEGVQYADYWLLDRVKLPAIHTLRDEARLLGFNPDNLKVEVTEFHGLPLYALLDGDVEIGTFPSTEIFKTRDRVLDELRRVLLRDIATAQATISTAAKHLAEIA